MECPSVDSHGFVDTWVNRSPTLFADVHNSRRWGEGVGDCENNLVEVRCPCDISYHSDCFECHAEFGIIGGKLDDDSFADLV